MDEKLADLILKYGDAASRIGYCSTLDVTKAVDRVTAAWDAIVEYMTPYVPAVGDWVRFKADGADTPYKWLVVTLNVYKSDHTIPPTAVLHDEFGHLSHRHALVHNLAPFKKEKP